MSKYERIIFWSAEDDCWVVIVPELAGCQADGPTITEALNNAETIIQEWIETANSLGREVPEPKGKVVFA